jgi:hypothetical protein
VRFSPADFDSAHEALEEPRATPGTHAFLDYVAERCLVDRFVHDRYMAEYFQARGLAALGEDRPRLPSTVLPPSPSDVGFAVYKAQLKADWTANPRSHVLDCEIDVAPRQCPTCKPKSKKSRTFRYGIYIPKAYVMNPGSVSSVLLLAPGGRGGRTRWFLDPVAYKSSPSRQSQGLNVQTRVDAYLAAHPDAAAPFVITMDDPGLGYTNGVKAFMTEDLIGHVLATYLPGKERGDIAYGIDAISSGSKNAALAFIDAPDAFDTFGWMCTFCDEKGFDADRYFAPGRRGDRALTVWRERAQAGELHMKFSIGKQDRFLACNQRLHQRLVKEEVIFDGHDPYETGCAIGTAKSECVTVKPSMTEYPGVGHNYSLMPLAFDDHLHWHIERLGEVAQTRGERDLLTASASSLNLEES